VDSICKIHGTAGLENGISYNQARGAWEPSLSTGSAATVLSPSPDDRGRIWNEGLAFYGWIFYISKFYEVIDTLIILAKGKYSSTLQTYHHAGAMMAMWAGMRYMSTPIWIFVFFNSAIHALMVIKRTLTSLQISQFIIGASVAIVHSFVSYLVPVQVEVAPAEATAVASSISASASATPSAGKFVDGLKKTLFGAAEAAGAAAVVSSSETNSTHQGASYVTRKAEVVLAKAKPDRRLSNVMLAEKASWDAAKGLEREVYGESKEGAIIEDSDDSSSNGKLHPSSAARANGVKSKANGKSKGRK
ncbi:hypothetical protein PC116_g29809, partial [Phytophthora cactorum]